VKFFEHIHNYASELSAIPRLIEQRTFSTFGEDSILFAALNPGHSGIYVDVGAHHPKFGSNTYRLYRWGWRGVAIEPNPEFSSAFRRLRPRDTLVGEGISALGGNLTYYQFKNSVHNTFSSERAEQLTRWGFEVVETKLIPTQPLRSILARECPDVHIDFLSIDSEGADLTVLQTAELSRIQPTAIMIEDFEGFDALKRGQGESEISQFLRAKNYAPIAQALYTTLYVSRDWPDLISRSCAFDGAVLRTFI
jgi:FkbM family methyltransferase